MDDELQQEGINEFASFAQGPSNLIKLYIIQQKNNVAKAIKKYEFAKSVGGDMPTAYIRANMIALFLEIESFMKRDLKKKEGEFEKIKSLVYSNDYDELLQGFEIISDWLDAKRITRIDTQGYDTTRWESANQFKNR